MPEAMTMKASGQQETTPGVKSGSVIWANRCHGHEEGSVAAAASPGSIEVRPGGDGRVP